MEDVAAWPPRWFGMSPAGFTDTSQRIDELLRAGMEQERDAEDA
ncbi:hypothetical protein [Nocardia farcinica]|nr:hypothetical protein [Nocardia farcinica]